MTYWPAYDQISPECRAGYLEWLAGGRCAPGAYIGYVFLFFYGLERRVLVDCARPGPARGDLAAIRSEVRRLRSLYGANNSFRGYATGLLGVIDVFGGAGRNQPPPVHGGDKWTVPLALRLGLAEFAAAGRPVPVSWALAWVRFHPEIVFRTPVERCPDEFARLFAVRYRARFGEGMVVRPNRTTVRVDYRSASAGIGSVSADTGMPDVFPLAAPANKLITLVAECTDELDPYSRWLGRNPDGRGEIAGSALLPACLVDRRQGQVGELLAWMESRLGSARHAVVDGADLIRFWTTQAEKSNRADTIALARLLNGQGFGFEPDPRFGGVPLAPGPVVLFRVESGESPSAPSAGYTAAATLLHLAAAVAGADDEVSESERAQLTSHLQSTLHLTGGERTRLEAHLRWLMEVTVKLTGLSKKLSALDTDQREAIAAFCLRVAAADGSLAAAEMAVLAKIYTLLRLDPKRVSGDAHALVTTTPVPGPVTVRPAGAAPSGYAIPDQRPGGGFRLDEAAITAKLAESAQVSALLGEIFTEDDRPVPAPVALPDSPAGPTAAGLDAPHTALLRALADRLEWTRVDVEDLCAGLGLLPDGALDTLNDAAFDVAGEPVAEGEDPIEINTDAMQEMLA